MKSSNKGINIDAPEFKAALSKFEDWRKNSRELGVRRRIPQDLWDLAVGLTGKYAIGSVAKVLRLSYFELKKRAQVQTGKTGAASSSPLQSSSFIELKLNESLCSSGLGFGTSGSQCLMELNRADGSHMKIYSTAGASIDITRICESFLNGLNVAG